MEAPGNISRNSKRKWEHGKFAQHSIVAQRLHVCNGPVKHRLHQAEGFFRDVLEERSGKNFEAIKVIKELDFKMRLRAGLDHGSATVQGKDSK